MANTGRAICGIIGDPVEHSLSPLIHNAGYEAMNLDFIYVPFKVFGIERAMEGVRGLGIRGVSVTMPYKVSVMEYIDDIDGIAEKIGAVNTVINENGVLKGFNTDYDAALKALDEATAIKGKRAILVGSGGAALAIALGLKKSGVELVILNRTKEKAKELAEGVKAEGFGGLEQLSLVSSADILINATSVGMWPEANETIVPKKLLHEGLTVFDIVYNPKETKLLSEALDKGCSVVYGYKMLLHQAATQFELFTECQPPLKVMERVLLKALGGGEKGGEEE